MVRIVLNLYLLLLIIDSIISYIPSIKKQLWAMRIKKIADYSLNPIRKFLPPDLPFDISPIIVILLIKILEAIW